MDKEYFIKLCLGVYEVTELFPENEPLKIKIRERADEILADLILVAGNPIKIEAEQKNRIYKRVFQGIEVLNNYFKIAQAQDWVDIRNFLVLNREYDKIKKEISAREQITAKTSPAINSVDIDVGSELKQGKELFLRKPSKEQLTDRQKKILEILKKQEKIQVQGIQRFFPQISKRTLRRDLKNLLKQKFIKSMGEHNLIFYKIADRT